MYLTTYPATYRMIFPQMYRVCHLLNLLHLSILLMPVIMHSPRMLIFLNRAARLRLQVCISHNKQHLLSNSNINRRLRLNRHRSIKRHRSTKQHNHHNQHNQRKLLTPMYRRLRLRLPLRFHKIKTMLARSSMWQRRMPHEAVSHSLRLCLLTPMLCLPHTGPLSM